MNNYRKVDTPCEGCNEWINNTEKLECTQKCEKWKNYIKTEKTCWTCAFGIVGYGCVYEPDNPEDVEVDYTCDDWVGLISKTICCCGMGNAMRDKSIIVKEDKLYIGSQDIVCCPFCEEVL